MSKKSVEKNRYYADLAKKANKAGVTNYSNLLHLSTGQKSYLSKLVKEGSPIRDVILNPKKFEAIEAPPKFLRNAKQAGQIAINGKLFVRNKYANGRKTYSRVRIEDGALKFDETFGNVTMSHTVIYPGTRDFFKISKQLQDGTYPLSFSNQVTFKIGGNSPFKRSFADFTSLYGYVSDMAAGKVLFNRKGGKKIYNVDFGKILPEISFVEIKRKKSRKKGK